jgi:hypothetical protein
MEEQTPKEYAFTLTKSEESHAYSLYLFRYLSYLLLIGAGCLLIGLAFLIAHFVVPDYVNIDWALPGLVIGPMAFCFYFVVFFKSRLRANRELMYYPDSWPVVVSVVDGRLSVLINNQQSFKEILGPALSSTWMKTKKWYLFSIEKAYLVLIPRNEKTIELMKEVGVE